MNDIELLRRFEPVIRFNAGEQFFPMDVEPYVKECSLWIQEPGEAPHCIYPDDEWGLDVLSEPRDDPFGSVLFMKFIDPLNITELAAYQLQQNIGRRKKDRRDVFHAGRGRLARVGYGSRFIDALFSLTLLARGRVPGDTAAAAGTAYRKILREQPHYRYYGRVVRQGHWIALQYWFFYAYNNWRSGFFGVNDHEADWEQISVYCYEDDDGAIKPAWVAYASHDFSGDDLRRRWDDPEIEKVNEHGNASDLGTHPVVYAAAGSHASYFQAGEYLTEIELPFLRPLVQMAERGQKARERAVAEYQGAQIRQQVAGSSDINIFRIPFVDYARGDGHSIGPGQERKWNDPGLLDPVPGWTRNYRGLWGLYAADPLSGEDAPAGPMYNRDGSVRRAWYDPVGWAGLDKVMPPSKQLEQVYRQRGQIMSRRSENEKQVKQLSSELNELGLELEAMRGNPHLEAMFNEHVQRIDELSAKLDETRAHLTRDDALLDSLAEYEEKLEAGNRGPMRAHIKHTHEPFSSEELRLGRIAEFWAAASIGLMMIGVVALAVFSPQAIWIGLAAIVGAFIIIEANFRKQMGQVITFITVILALVATGILLVEFFWAAVILLVLVTGGYILWENMREFFS